MPAVLVVVFAWRFQCRIQMRIIEEAANIARKDFFGTL